MHDLHVYAHAFKGATALLGGVVGWFFGQADGFLLALIAFTIADYVSGVLAAIATRQLSSAVGFKGIAKKILIFTLVGLAHLLDAHLLHGADALRMAVVFFYISNEGISLIENAARLGLPVPPQVREVLKTLTTGSPPTPQTRPLLRLGAHPHLGVGFRRRINAATKTQWRLSYTPKPTRLLLKEFCCEELESSRG